jgi:small subunit ribosomal protein S16
MLAIRMQRTGRHGHAMFRMVVQDARRTPTSGNIVALLGSYDPHTKTAVFDKEKAAYYLEHGAQPSDRVVYLMKSQGVKLPSWVSVDTKKTATIRNQDKLRRNRPASETAPEPKVEDAVVAPEAETAEPVIVDEAILDAPVVEETTNEEESSEEAVPAPEAESAQAEENTEEEAEATIEADLATEEPLEK